MPRLPDTADFADRPVTVALSELAIAAGLFGDSVTVACDCSADVLCQLWRHLAQRLGAEHVAHIVSAGDMKQARKQLTQLRAIFVRSPRLQVDVAWMIQMAEADSMGPRPALFCGSHVDVDSDPGPVVPLSVDERESDGVLEWVDPDGNLGSCDVEVPSGIGCDSRLAALLRRSDSSVAALGHRELQTLRALLAGASLLRSAAGDAEPRDIQMTLTDYRLVRGLLCSPVVHPNREACNPLTLAMIRRANVYLAVKYGNDPACPMRVPPSRRERCHIGIPHGVITRRELADLGNIRSRLVTTLIEYLKVAEAGYSLYCRMGCLGTPTPESRWRRVLPRDLARELQPWSAKQVRTHFDRLRKGGLVQAERHPANGPLCLRIPEELEIAESPYSALPTLEV